MNSPGGQDLLDLSPPTPVGPGPGVTNQGDPAPEGPRIGMYSRRGPRISLICSRPRLSGQRGACGPPASPREGSALRGHEDPAVRGTPDPERYEAVSAPHD